MATNLANLDAGGSVNSNAQAHELIQLVQRCHANVPELTMGLAIEPEDKQCPGLYSKGCTGELIQTVNGETGQPIWKCHMSVETYGRYDSGVASTAAAEPTRNFFKRGCGYKLYPKTHLKYPTLSISISGDNTVEVLPAEGGAVIVSMCGGVEGLLRIVDPALLELEGCCSVSLMRVEYDISSYRQVLKRLMDFRLAVGAVDPERSWFGLEPIPGSTQNQYLGFGDKNRSPDEEVDERFNSLPLALRSALLPFQKEGIRYVLQRKGRALIADEMGVGKTVQGIALAGCFADKWPVLVVVPASLRLVWAEEFEKWMPHLSPSDIHVIFDSADKLRDSDAYNIVITSYDMLRRLACKHCCDQEEHQTCSVESCIVSRNAGWRMIIADESHKLATSATGSDSQITNSVRSVCSRADHVVFLSGTPSLNKPFDLYNQINMIRRDVLPSTRDAFGVKYCDKRLVPCRFLSSGFRVDYSGLCRSKELHLLLRKEVMIRRMKTDIAEQLPDKIRQVVRLPEPMQSEWPAPWEIVRDEEGNEIERKRLSQFHRVGIAKSDMVVQWLLEKLGSLEDSQRTEDASKIVVFAHHKKVMNKLASRLDAAQPGIYVRIDGETDSQTRHEEVAKFQLSSDVRVAVVSVTAGGTGLDFSAASAVVFAELPPHAALVRQAEDRVHRRGQKNNVNVFFLCAMNTFDDRQWQFLNKRLQRVDKVHNGPAANDADGDAGEGGGGGGSGQHEHGLTVGDVVRYGVGGIGAGGGSLNGINGIGKLDRGRGRDLNPAQTAALLTAIAAGMTDVSELTSSQMLTLRKTQAAANEALAPATNGYTNGTGVGKADDNAGDAASDPADGPHDDCNMIPCSQSSESDEECYQGSYDEWNPRWKFVVSRHTKRIHIFKSIQSNKDADADADAGNAVGVLFSVPIMAITGSPEDCVRNLLDAYTQMQRNGFAAAAAEADTTSDTTSNTTTETKSIMLQGVGPMFIDLLAVPTVQIFEAALRQCTQFAREWIEISNIYKDRLYDRLLQTPLDAIVEEEMKAAHADGETGTSLTRYVASTTTSMRGFHANQALLAKYPVLRTALELHGTVSYNGRVYPYVQAVLKTVPGDADAEGLDALPNQLASAVPQYTRLCLNCTKPADTVDADAFQEDITKPSLLFCTIKCENDMKVKSSGGAIRAQIMKRDRGICELCKLNCTKLIQRLQAIEKDDDKDDCADGDDADSWRARRTKLLDEEYPEFTKRLTKAQKNGLVEKALSGRAWQADHVVAVFEGGGHCTLANMRTLCTACHREVTAAQAACRKKERAAIKAARRKKEEEEERKNNRGGDDDDGGVVKAKAKAKGGTRKGGGTTQKSRKKRKTKAEQQAEKQAEKQAVAGQDLDLDERENSEKKDTAQDVPAETAHAGGKAGLELILTRARMITMGIATRRLQRGGAREDRRPEDDDARSDDGDDEATQILDATNV